MEEKISSSVKNMFLTTGKEMWDTLKVMYGNDKNPSRVLRSMSACLSSSREINLCPSPMENAEV